MAETFTPLSMMEFRSNPGTVIDRMRYRGERFVLTRRDKPVAYLIPATNVFAPTTDGVDAAVRVHEDGRFSLEKPA